MPVDHHNTQNLRWTMNQRWTMKGIYRNRFSFLSTGVLSVFLALTLFQIQKSGQDNLYDPVALFLTWQQDPTTTMTIDWHTKPEEDRLTRVQYKKPGEDHWNEVMGDYHPFPHTERMIHRVELTGLQPETTYRFRFGEDSKSYKFRTMPANLHRPLRFATGGDTLPREGFQMMNKTAMQYDPDFMVWGGDLAYGNGDPARIKDYWYPWFDGTKRDLIDENGRVVPIVLAIGNHEYFNKGSSTVGGNPHGSGMRLSDEEVEAYMEEHSLSDRLVTFFFDLFAFPGQPAYNVLDFGKYLSIVILDSGHHSSIEGGQKDWLEGILSERRDRPHVFPVYHVPAYPSARSYNSTKSIRIRENWVPLFEEYGIRVAFENHDHAYKRTHPMLQEKIHPDGIVYMGDGMWGDPTLRRQRDSEHQNYYIDRFQSARHAIIVTLHGPYQHFLVVRDDGEIIDEYPGAHTVAAPLRMKR